MNVVTIILQVLLGVLLVCSGFRKIVGTRRSRENYDKWRYPQWLRPITGLFDLVGAAGMFAGIFVPAIAPWAALWVCILMVAALYTRVIRVRDKAWVLAAIIFVLSAVVVYLRFGVLFISLLLVSVAPDPAPLAVVPAAEVVRFEQATPELFESIALDAQGNIYVTLATAGEIRKIAPDGTQSTFARLPVGEEFDLFNVEGLLLTMVIDPEGDLYTTLASVDPENRGVWRITPDGTSELWAQLPPETGPNGITIDQQGNLFVADSTQKLIWRIPSGSREAEKWLVHDLLGTKGNRVLPGPNGVKFWKGDLYVSVSNARTVVRIPVQPDGSAGEPSVYIDGIPPDDFAFDQQGNAYLTTHFFNTIIRVGPDGSRAIIATEDQGVVGPTAVAFGRLPEQQDKLFVVDDGGFGNPLSKGVPNVVKLDIGIPGLPIP